MSRMLDLADLGAEQAGLFTAGQARTLGVSAQQLARMANRGTIERLAHGVYRVAGAAPTPDEGLRVAWLALDPSRRATVRLYDPEAAVVSHRSAARLHELGDVEGDNYEFTVGERKQSRRSEVKLHRGRVPAKDRTVISGLPVTTVLRTIADLAAARLDGGHLAGAVRDALTVKQVDTDELAAALRPYAHLYGAPLGDGGLVLALFLHEAGVSDTLERAVALADRTRSPASSIPFTVIDRAQLDRLNEQLASIRASIDLAADPNTQESLRRLGALTQQVLGSPVLEQVWKVDGPTQQAVEQAQRVLQDPYLKRFLDNWKRETR